MEDECGDIPMVLVQNKIDLISQSEIDQWVAESPFKLSSPSSPQDDNCHMIDTSRANLSERYWPVSCWRFHLNNVNYHQHQQQPPPPNHYQDNHDDNHNHLEGSKQNGWQPSATWSSTELLWRKTSMWRLSFNTWRRTMSTRWINHDHDDDADDGNPGCLSTPGRELCQQGECNVMIVMMVLANYINKVNINYPNLLHMCFGLDW